jgi:hypothetical protein
VEPIVYGGALWLGYQSLKSGFSAFCPKEAKRLLCEAKVSEQEHKILRVFERVKDEICQGHGLTPSNIKIATHSFTHHQVHSLGNSSSGLISVQKLMLEKWAFGDKEANNPFMEAYQEDLNSFADDPAQLKQQIQELPQEKLRSILGLSQRCQNVLSENELYFILKHEIVGHLQNDDLKKRCQLIFTASVTYMVSLLAFPASQPKNFVLSGLYLFIQMLQIDQCRKQEVEADYKACENDLRATQGAKTYFKKAMIVELASHCLNKESENNIAQCLDAHPSHEERLSAAIRMESILQLD